MQEAFRNAARKAPKNPLVHDIFDMSNQIRRENRQQAQARELIHLQRNFQEIGREWFLLKGNPRAASQERITELKVKEKWGKAFNTLLRRDQIEQGELLNSFATGLRLTGENPHNAYQSIIDTLSGYDEKIGLLQRLRGQQPPTHLQPVARLFILVFADIQNYPQAKRDDLYEFVLTKSGHSGRVSLDQSFEGIAGWLKAIT